MSQPLIKAPEETNDQGFKDSYAQYGEADFTATQLEDTLIHTFQSSSFLAYISVDDEDESSYFLQTVSDDDGDEWYAIYSNLDNAKASSILEEGEYPDRHNVLVEVDYEFLLNEMFNTGDDDIYGIVINPETELFTLDRMTLSRMGLEENEGVDHHESIGTRVPGNMEFSWLYDEYMTSEGEEEKDNFRLLMDDIVTRSCLALVAIVNKADLITLPDGSYELKENAGMILPSLTAEDQGKECSYLPLFTSNEQIEKWGIKDNIELKEGQVVITQCRPFIQHAHTFDITGEYDALLVNPFDQAFIIHKDFIDLLNHKKEEEDDTLAS